METGRYSAVAVALHWVIAGCIVFCLILGTFMESLPEAYRSDTVRAHASAGMLVLVLSLVRVVWRVTHRAPAHPGLTPVERWAATLVHVVLYAGMLVMPMIGWAIMSAHPASERRVIRLFGAYDMPVLGPVEAVTPGAVQDDLHDRLVQLHTLGGWMFLVLLIAHVGGALKHQLLDRQPQLQRMWVGRSIR